MNTFFYYFKLIFVPESHKVKNNQAYNENQVCSLLYYSLKTAFNLQFITNYNFV